MVYCAVNECALIMSYLSLRWERFRLPWDGFEPEDMANDDRQGFEPTTGTHPYQHVKTASLQASGCGRPHPSRSQEGVDLRPTFPLWCTSGGANVATSSSARRNNAAGDDVSGGGGNVQGSGGSDSVEGGGGSGSVEGGGGSGSVEGGDEVVATKKRGRRLNVHTPGSIKTFTAEELEEEERRYVFECDEDDNFEDANDGELEAAAAAAVTPAAAAKDGGKKKPARPPPPQNLIGLGSDGATSTTPKTPRISRVAPASGGAKSGLAPLKRKCQLEDDESTGNDDDGDDDVFVLPSSQKNMP